ncbi:MAG: hypothetical protein BWY89_00038 [Bacteroidetes bacterium ADurb.BinA012]|jgi:predicted RNase H-like nuclease (RuvC/YqgF family)|nr:MAG: hypothetical protein BWY89_00038 [Bacteroidetes bacterium ADurb.BinA012]
MGEVLTTVLIALGTGFSGAFSGWFFGRKKQNIATIDMALNTWQKVIDQLEARVDVLLNKVKALEDENAALREEVIQLRAEIQESHRNRKKIELLERKIARYEKLLADNGIDF